MSDCEAEHSFPITPAKRASDEPSDRPSDQTEESCPKNVHQLIGTLVEYPPEESDCSSHMSQTLSTYNNSDSSNVIIRFNKTKSVIEEERQAKE